MGNNWRLDEGARIRCKGCGEEIDPDVCWCGDMVKSNYNAPHSDNHDAVPMGCRCHYATPWRNSVTATPPATGVWEPLDAELEVHESLGG